MGWATAHRRALSPSHRKLSAPTYSTTEPITADFTLTAACAAGTWVGIYRDQVTPGGASSAALWLNTCGDQTCTTVGPASGTLLFNGNAPDESGKDASENTQTYPLPAADYQVYLLGPSGGYDVIDGPVTITLYDRR